MSQWRLFNFNFGDSDHPEVKGVLHMESFKMMFILLIEPSDLENIVLKKIKLATVFKQQKKKKNIWNCQII